MSMNARTEKLLEEANQALEAWENWILEVARKKGHPDPSEILGIVRVEILDRVAMDELTISQVPVAIRRRTYWRLLTYHKRERPRAPCVLDPDYAQPKTEGESGKDLVIAERWDAFRELTTEEQRVLWLKHVRDELSDQQRAEELDIPVETFRTKVKRAACRLKNTPLSVRNSDQ